MKYFLEYSTQREGLKSIACDSIGDCMRKARQLNGLAALIMSYSEGDGGALFLVGRHHIDGREAFPVVAKAEAGPTRPAPKGRHPQTHFGRGGYKSSVSIRKGHSK